MTPRARITGGETLDSPMRITYDDGSSSENEGSGRPTLRQVLKKPSRLLLRKSSSNKLSSPPSTSRSGSSAGRELRSRSIKYTPSIEYIHGSQAEEGSDCFDRESPLMETRQMTEALPELSQPMPKRTLPRANLEAIMTKPLPAPPLQEPVHVIMQQNQAEPVTALPPMPRPDTTLQKRKSSGELAEGNERSLPKTKPDAVNEVRVKKNGSRISKNAFAETAVLQWIDGVDQGDGVQRPQTAQAPVVATAPSSVAPKPTSSHDAVVFSMMEQNKDNIAKAAAKLCSAPEIVAPPIPESSSRRKRDSSMTATSFTPSIFSRASTLTDHTFLTTPSEMVAGEVRTKRGSHDSRDSWRYTRSFASPRSSVMSYSSIPFRSRPFKSDDAGGSEDNSSGVPSDADAASKERSLYAESRFQDTATANGYSFPANEYLMTPSNRPLSLSPVEESPEIRISVPMDVDDNDERRQSNLSTREIGEDDKASVSASTVDFKGTMSKNNDSDDLSRQSRTFRGAFSPGMPREIFGYHTLDFSASAKLAEEIASQAQVEPETEEIRGMGKARTLEHRRSVSSDVFNSRAPSPTIKPHTYQGAPPAIVRQVAKVNDSVTSSEASLSPTESEFGEGSSGITDYTDDDIYLLSDTPGIGRVLQLALANIRRDVVERVMNELHGITTHAHETNAYGNGNGNTGGQLPPQSSSSMAPANLVNGRNGTTKRPARDGGDEPEEREDGDPGKRRKLNTGGIHSSIMRARFACPFYKRNPDNHQRWRSCRGPGWEEVRRVKEHVYRRHMLFTCPRCLQSFEEKSVLENHAQTDIPCTKATTPPPQDFEGCSQDQERKLRCRKRPPGETDEDRWAEMYRILFGDDCDVPGPYYDFDLPSNSPSPSDMPIIEDTFRHLPQRLAADINRRLRRPLDDEERDALPEIIRTSLQAVMPPFWRMFAAPPTSDIRAAPPASDQGDSAYGSAEHDRESSAPPRPYHHAAQMSQTTLSHVQTPNQTPSQHQSTKLNYNPPPSRDFSFPQNVDQLYNNPSAWPQSTQSFVTMPQMPGTSTYPQTYHHAPTSMAQTSYGPPAHSTGDPPIHQDFGDLLVPTDPYMPEDQKHKEPALRWSIPDTSAAEIPALPLHSVPYSMPQEPQYHHPQTYDPHPTHPPNHYANMPTTTMGQSPNFHQYINVQQPMNQYNPPVSYPEVTNGGMRTPNNDRQSVNLLTTTDQIDSWVWSLGAGSGGNAPQVQNVFGGDVHHANTMGMGMGLGVKGKKRSPEVYSRG